MTPFLTYLLKVFICSGLLTGYYYLALRNRAFHHWNRFYLLSTVLLSLTVPLFTFTIFHSGDDGSAALQLLQAMGTGEDYVVLVARKSAPSITLEQGLTWTYAAVSATLLLLLAVALLKLRGLIKKHAVQQVQNIQFISTDAKGTPFSFFRYIFWNPSIDLQSETGARIFKHELAHVREGHSLDKLLLQLVLVLFWCNPFFWIIRYELRMIHEFIADRKALDQQDASALAAMILQAAYPTQYNELTNSFFHQSIKRRIHMLTKNQSPRFSYISRLLFLPLAASLVLAFSVRAERADGLPVVDTQTIPGRAAGLLPTLNDTLPPSKKIKEIIVTDAVIKVQYEDGSTANMTLAEANKQGLNMKATLKDAPGATPSGVTIRGKFEGLVLVDGKEYTGNIEELNTEGIEKVNVLQGKDAIAKYGNKAEKGAIEISMKDVTFTTGTSGFTGLVMVDGKEYTGDFNQIDANLIEMVNVLKDEAATKKYGDKGKNGVIEITLKKPTTLSSAADTMKPKKGDIPQVVKVEKEAQFPGGAPAWRKFLETNLKAVVPVDKGAPEGTYTVMAQLLIDTDGSLLEVKTLSKHGYGMEEEVERTLKLSPKWVPAQMNGRAVKAYRKQPITFVVSSGDTKETTLPIALQSGATLSVAQLQSIPFHILVKPEATHTLHNSSTALSSSDYAIYSAKFTIDGANGDIHEATIASEQPSNRIKSLIAGATPGRLVTIDSRVGITKDGKQFKLPSLVYFVK